jgi:hypothetical protein
MESIFFCLNKNIRSRLIRQVLIALVCNVLFCCYMLFKFNVSRDVPYNDVPIAVLLLLYWLFKASWLSFSLFILSNVFLRISIFFAKRIGLESNLSVLMISMIRYTLVYFVISFFEEDTEVKISFTLIYLIILAITEFVEIYNSHRSSANTMDH